MIQNYIFIKDICLLNLVEICGLAFGSCFDSVYASYLVQRFFETKFMTLFLVSVIVVFLGKESHISIFNICSFSQEIKRKQKGCSLQESNCNVLLKTSAYL